MKVMIDNFYTILELLEELRARGLLACGTVQANPGGLPANLLPRNVHLHRGEFHVAQKDLMCAVWVVTLSVLIMSNYYHTAARGSVELRNVEGVHGRVPLLKTLQDYQVHMNGVNLCDQMIGYHLSNHRSKK